jgi:hypothetical protein
MFFSGVFRGRRSWCDAAGKRSTAKQTSLIQLAKGFLRDEVAQM